MNRQTIAENCGVTNNKGKVEERQFRVVGTILSTLSENFWIVEYKIAKKKIDGQLKSRYEIYNVKTKNNEMQDKTYLFILQ